ncbi:MAG: hypothetical protein IT330_17665 [Anaerolineae bacterium]|nr:hypothetical protein [Anaerolineae bacterium]
MPTITPPAPTPRPTRPCRQGDLGRIVDRGQIFIYVYRERRQLSGLMGCELGVGDQVTIMGGRERGEQTYGSIFWLPVHYVTQKGQICEGWVPEPLVECTQDIIISTATPLPPTSTNTSVPRPTFTLTPRLPAPTPSPTPLAAPSITSPPPDFRASSRLEILWDWEPALKENWRYDVRFFWAGEADPFYTELRKERRAEIKVDEWKPGEVFITVRVVEVDDEGEYKGVDVSRESEPVRVQVVRPQPEPPAPTPTPLRGDISAWNETTALPEAFGHSPAVIFGNAIYMAGGEGPPGYFRTKVYYAPIQPDGTIGNWRETSPLPNPVHYHATTVANGHLYVLGGVRNGSPSKDVYRAKINSDGTLAPWSISTALPVALVAPAAVTSGNKIYVLGGHSGISNEKSVYYASSRSNGDLSDWNFTEPLPEPLSWLSAVVQGKRVYAVAGASFDRVTSWSRGVYYADIDPEGRLAPWHAATPLPKAMGNHVALISKGFLYVVGGLSGKSQAWSFYAPVNKDGSIGAWSETRPIPQPIHDHSAVVWHDRIYVLGGFSDDARRYQNKVYLTSP